MKIMAAYQEKEQYIWCVVCEDAYLYRLDRNKRKMEEVLPLLDDVYTRHAYSKILSYKDFLIFVPLRADKIALFNRIDTTIEYIAIPETEFTIGEFSAKFYSGKVYKDKLFLFGYTFPGILKVNLITKEVRVIDSWLNKVCFHNSEDGCFCTQYAERGNEVFLPYANANDVLQLDLETEEIIIHEVGNENQRYSSMEWDGSNFWLSPRDGNIGSIIKWNVDSQEAFYVMDYPSEFEMCKYPFGKIVSVENKVLFFADYSNLNLCMDTTTEKMSILDHLYDVQNMQGCKYPVILVKNKEIIILRDMEEIIWNYSKNTKITLSYEWDPKTMQRYEDKRIQAYFVRKNGNGYNLEREGYALKEYLRYITSAL